jgi:hypothetical protein
MKLRTLALTLLCSASPLAAQQFEGTVTMNMVSDDGSSRSMSYLIKGGKMRFDPAGAPVSVIIDPVGQHMILIMNAQKMYMERDFTGALAAMQPPGGVKTPAMVRTGKTEVVAGYKCEHITITDDDGQSVDACVSSELGGFRLPAASNPMAPQKEAGWMSQVGATSFPLKVTKGGKTIVVVSAIEKKPLDPALFAAPEGYTSFAMPRRPDNN